MNEMNFYESEDYQSVNYNIKIKSSLNKRLADHMRALKHIEGQNYTKKRWVQEAIKEKLESWENNKDRNFQADCSLGFGISLHINNKITEIINFLKKYKIKASKTDFFLEAIHEKLHRDEEKTKNLLQSMIKTTVEVK